MAELKEETWEDGPTLYTMEVDPSEVEGVSESYLPRFLVAYLAPEFTDSFVGSTLKIQVGKEAFYFAGEYDYGWEFLPV